MVLGLREFDDDDVGGFGAAPGWGTGDAGTKVVVALPEKEARWEWRGEGAVDEVVTVVEAISRPSKSDAREKVGVLGIGRRESDNSLL